MKQNDEEAGELREPTGDVELAASVKRAPSP